MKGLFLLFFLLSTNTVALDDDPAAEGHSINIDELTVTIVGTYKIEIFKENKHVFSYDCSNSFLCEIFVTNKRDPEYVYSDGLVQPSVSVFTISIDNINSFKESNANYTANYIAFVVSQTSATAAWGERTHYQIDTRTGGVQINKISWDWMRYGMPEPASK